MTALERLMGLILTAIAVEMLLGGIRAFVGGSEDMSKAFTRESENVEEQDDVEEANPIPEGSKNYLTPGGWQRMRDEVRWLVNEERPQVTNIVSWAAKNGDRSENGDYLYGKKRLREIDRRIRYLTKRLEVAEVVDPGHARGDRPGLLRRDGHLRDRERRGAHDPHRRHRRDRPPPGAHQLGLARGARAHQGARGRYGDAEHAGRRRGARDPRGPLRDDSRGAFRRREQRVVAEREVARTR